MAIVRVGADDIYYDVSGAGTGLPVLLLMGLGTDSNAWERQVPALASGRRVIVVDNRGVGRSGKPAGPYSTAAMAADALAVLDAVGVARAHVVGVSLGGAIAQELVLADPGRVASLALIATFAMLDGDMKSAGKDVQLDPAAIIAFLMPRVFSKEFMDKERAFLVGLWQRAMAYGISPAGFAGQVAAVLAHDTRARLASVRVPTLVMTGDADRLVPPALSRHLAEAIPGARLVEIQGGTHGMTMERADEVNAVLATWLAEND